jgi:hypothetical protein
MVQPYLSPPTVAACRHSWFSRWALVSGVGLALHALSSCRIDDRDVDIEVPRTSGGTGGNDADGDAGSSAGSSGAEENGAGGGGGGAGGSASDGGAAGTANAAGSAGSAGSGSSATSADLSFFVTSVGSGADGGNLAGLTGADERCEMLAAAVGAGAKVWRAYLSTSTVNARDRIGDGPWVNAAGDTLAANVAELHDENRVLNGEPNLMLDETGAAVPINEYDILTGSSAAGELLLDPNNGNADVTCVDWTSNAAAAPGPRVGHSSIPSAQFSPSWNSAHNAPGCDQISLADVGGAGRIYCFAE